MVLVGSNMSGSEKLKLLIIGKSKNPRAFRGIKSLGIVYYANQKAWMTSAIWLDWLTKLDKMFGRQNRKIILFVDNCPSHPKEIVSKLRFVRVEYFPPNATSELQPMDMGIINSLKTHYRRRILNTVLNRMEDVKPTATSLLEAVKSISTA